MDPELKLAELLVSVSMSRWPVVTRANEFDENDSDKEPSKSISTAGAGAVPFDADGAAIQGFEKIIRKMSILTAGSL